MLGVFSGYDTASLALLVSYWRGWLERSDLSQQDIDLARGIVRELEDELARRDNN